MSYIIQENDQQYQIVENDGQYTLTIVNGSNITNFTNLLDTPSTYVGQAGKFPRVNTGETALEFVASSVSDGDAIHINVADEFSGTTQKVTPVAADRILLENSENSFNKNWILFGDIGGGDLTSYFNMDVNTLDDITAGTTNVHLTTTLKSNYDTAYSHSQTAHAPANAEQNVQADWNQADSGADDYIKNKPTLGGSGDVVGPASATDNAVTRFDSTTGKLIQNSQVTVDDNGSVDIPTGQAYKINGMALSYSDIGAAASGHNHSGVYEPAKGVDDNYVTDAEKIVIGNTSNTNSGDETTTTLGSKIAGATAKAIPVDADNFGYSDSEATNILKKFTWANIKSALKTYFDTLYQVILVSGTNIKTINSTTLLGSGDIAIVGLTDGDKGDITIGSSGTTFTIDAGAVTEAKQTLADNTTGNCSTSAHGYLKKLDNDATHFMNGAGNWATPTIIDLGALSTTNETYSGIISTETVDTNSVGFGCVLAIASDGNYDEADADAIANAYNMCLALETGTGTKKVLRYGRICDTDWTWTVGGTIYLSTTLGTMTQTAPTGADDTVIILGWATHADAMIFNPYVAHMEHTG